MGNTPSSQASPSRRKLYKPRSLKNASAANLRSASCVSVPASSRSCDLYLASASQPSFRSRPPSTRSRRHQVSEPEEPVPPLPRALSWHSRLQPRRRQSNASSSSHFDTLPVLDPSLFTQPRPAVADNDASSPFSLADFPSSISSPPPHDHALADRPASSGGAVAAAQGSARPDSSMCVPMRRRSLVLTPGLATRFLAQEIPPPLPSSMPPAIAAAPANPTRPPPMPPLDTVRALALGPLSTANSDTWERSATPCDTNYRQLGVIKFGSLRIANGSPDLSPAADHDDDVPQLPPAPQARPFFSASPLGQEPATAVVLDVSDGLAKPVPCDLAKGPAVEASHAVTTSEPDARAPSIGVDTTLASERASNLTPSPGPDPGPGASSNPPPPHLVTVTGSSRYDNGLPSPASSASDGSPEASSKADSGYASNNSSVRSVRRHATSYPEQPRRRPPPPPGLLPQRTLLKPTMTVTPLTIPPEHQFDRPAPSSRRSLVALSRDKFRRLSTLAGTRSSPSSPAHLSDYSILPGVGLESNLPPPRRPSTSYLGSTVTSRSKGMQDRLQRLLRGHKKQPFRPVPNSPMERMTSDQEPVLHRYRPLSSYHFSSTSSHPFPYYGGREESRLCMSSLQLPTVSASGPEKFAAASWNRQRHSYHGGVNPDVLATTPPPASTRRLLSSAGFASRPLSDYHPSGPAVGPRLRPSTSGGEYDAVMPMPTAGRNAGSLDLEPAQDYFSLPAPAPAPPAVSQPRVRYQPWPGPAQTQNDAASNHYPRRPPPYRQHLARRSMVDSTASLSSRPWRSEVNLHEPMGKTSSPPPVSLQIGRPKGLHRLSSLPPPSNILRLGSPGQHDDGTRTSLNHRRRPSPRPSVAVPEMTAVPRNRHSYAGPGLNYLEGAPSSGRPIQPPSSLLAYRQPLNPAYKTIDPRRHSYSRDFPYRALRGFV